MAAAGTAPKASASRLAAPAKPSTSSLGISARSLSSRVACKEETSWASFAAEVPPLGDSPFPPRLPPLSATPRPSRKRRTPANEKVAICGATIVQSIRLDAAAHRLAPGQRLAQRHLVGMLEVGPDREAAREPGDGHPPSQQAGDVERRRLTGGGRVGRD